MSLWTSLWGFLDGALESPYGTLIADLMLKSSVVLLMAFLAARALRRASAAARHLVWGLAVVALLGLPFLSWALPGWRLDLPRVFGKENLDNWADGALFAQQDSQRNPEVALPGTENATVMRKVQPWEAVPSLESSTPALLPGPAPGATGPEAPVSERTTASWFLAGWALGLVLTLLPLLIGGLSLVCLRRFSRRIEEGPLFEILTQLSAQFGLRRRVTLKVCERRCIPMTWGWVRPVILLPAEAQAWPAERLWGVLTHELAHVRRWDWLLQVLGQLVRALYWFNPLAWIALGRLRAEQELACDDEVLNAGRRPSDYAAELLTLMVNLPPGFPVSSMALALGRARALERRLRSILDPEHNQQPLTRRDLGLASVAALCLLVPLTTMQLFPSPAVRADVQAVQEPAQDPLDSQLTKVLAEVEAKIRSQYFTNPKDQALREGAIRGMVESLKDPFSTYITKEEAADLRRTIGERWTGIGVQLRISDKGPVVFSPLLGSPAQEAGLRPGDLLVAVDDKPVQGLSLPEVVRLILGPAGKPVKLKIQPVQGQVKEVLITRAEIKVPSLAGVARRPDGNWNFLLDSEPQIGYVRISSFQSATAKELHEVLRRLTEAGMKGLILDLRFCPGGTLDVAVHTAELFLDQGKKIVSLHGREGTKQVFAARKKGMLLDLPLVVLVNEYTASGAEVVAGALKDNGRALVLGTRTFGKGSVQSLLPLGEGGAQLKLTTAHFQLPSGRSIQKLPQSMDWGVDPTDGFYLPMTPKQNQALSQHLTQSEVLGKTDPTKPPELGLDPQRDGAVQTLIAKLTKGEYAKVGLPSTAFRAQIAEREKLRAEKEQLQKQLENLNRRLQELEKTAPGKKD